MLMTHLSYILSLLSSCQFICLSQITNFHRMLAQLFILFHIPIWSIHQFWQKYYFLNLEIPPYSHFSFITCKWTFDLPAYPPLLYYVYLRSFMLEGVKPSSSLFSFCIHSSTLHFPSITSTSLLPTLQSVCKWYFFLYPYFPDAAIYIIPIFLMYFFVTSSLYKDSCILLCTWSHYPRALWPMCLYSFPYCWWC